MAATTCLPKRSRTTPTAECQVCNGRGWISPNVPVGHADFGTITPCQCQESRLEGEQRDRLLTYSNLGHLTRFRFENLEPDGLSDSEISKSQFRKAYDVARVYANDPKGLAHFHRPKRRGQDSPRRRHRQPLRGQ